MPVEFDELIYSIGTEEPSWIPRHPLAVQSLSPGHEKHHALKKISRKNQFPVNDYGKKIDDLEFASQRQSHQFYLRKRQPKYILNRLKGEGGAWGGGIVLHATAEKLPK